MLNRQNLNSHVCGSTQHYLQVKTEVPTEKAEFATNCAIHGNVLAETLTGKAEAATGCAIHGNVEAEAATGKAEAATDFTKSKNVLA